MTPRRATGAIVAVAIGGLLALVAAPHGQPASAADPASAATTHRAAVVVDLGDGQVKVGCVSFTEDHISGLEALDRASMAPVAQTYGGQGGAVCALCGKGCAAGSTCLTCKAPNYWAYYHDGTYSSIGASRSEVRDGDVEGWRWGKGERPAKVPFDQVCLASTGPRPTSGPTTTRAAPVVPVVPVVPVTPRPATTTSTPRVPITGSGSGTAGPTVPTGPGNPGTTPGNATTSTTTTTTTAPAGTTPTSSAASVPPSTIAPTPDTGSKDAGARTEQKSASKGSSSAIGRERVVIERAGAGSSSTGSVQTGRSSHSPVWSIAGFAAAIAIVAGLIVVLRRRRATLG